MPIASDALRGYTEAIILRRLMDKDSYGYEYQTIRYRKRPKGSMN